MSYLQDLVARCCAQAGDWTALMANFGEMATVGAAVKEDCDFGKVRGRNGAGGVG
jgi:hypothetical protein